MKILEWTVWSLHLVVTASFSYACLTDDPLKVMRRYTVFHAVVIYWFVAAWSLYFPTFNKLHLIWLDVLVLRAAILLCVDRHFFLRFGSLSRYSPPAFPALAVALLMILCLLTKSYR